MPIKSREQLKPRFNTGMYPSQDDFHNWLNSYFHKSDRIPVQTVEGINDLLNTNNATLLKEVQKVVDSYHAIDYEQKDLSTIDITPFKHVVSIHQITEDTEIGFSDLSGKTGIVKLIVENTAEADVVLSFPQMADLIVFADDDNCLLPKDCFTEIILTGYGDYQTLCYRVSQAKKNTVEYQKGKISSIYHEYSADPNGSGTEGTWLTTPRDWDTPPYDGANDNFGSNDPSNNTPWRLNGINKQTLQTVEIGEHVFTRQNFMFKYRYDKPQNYANVTQEEIDEAFATTPVQIAETYDQSRYYNGAYTLCDAVVYDAVNTGVFYNNRTDRVETDRFKIPTAGDYAQMLSMADDTTYQGILQFVAVKPAKTDTQGTIIENGGDEQLPYPYDHIWENTTDRWDLSGLHLVPSARRYNAGNGDLTGAFYAYRKSVGLRIANEDGTLSSSILAIYSNADSNTAGVALNNGSTYHLSSVRLCRRKTTQELGYQLYADTANDKVIVTSWDSPAPVVNDIKLEPIPIGRLRGICVRYLNADKTQVLASLSSLQAKVELTNTGKGRWSGFDNY